MPVTSSTAEFSGPVQADGSRQVEERHGLAGGGELVLLYCGDPSEDILATATARASSIALALADQEASDNFDRDGPPTMTEMTRAEFAARIRERYRNADREEACRLAYWLSRRIAAGEITDAQCRTAFGLTSAQWTTFKSNKLTPQSNAWAAVIAATGG